MVASLHSVSKVEVADDEQLQVPRHEPNPTGPPISREPSNGQTFLVSPTPSVEGDDENSSADDLGSDMEQAGDDHRYKTQYEGEDTRLTSRKEIAGWYRSV